jgi:hypothetical protein
MGEKLICIGLAIIHGHAFFRGVLGGIRRYAEARPQWLLVPFVPFPRLPLHRPDSTLALPGFGGTR